MMSRWLLTQCSGMGFAMGFAGFFIYVVGKRALKDDEQLDLSLTTTSF